MSAPARAIPRATPAAEPAHHNFTQKLCLTHPRPRFRLSPAPPHAPRPPFIPQIIAHRPPCSSRPPTTSARTTRTTTACSVSSRMAMLSRNGVAEKSLGACPAPTACRRRGSTNGRLGRARAEPEQEEVTAASGMVMANTAVGGPMMFSDPQRCSRSRRRPRGADPNPQPGALELQRKREAAAAYEAQQLEGGGGARDEAQQQAHLQHLRQAAPAAAALRAVLPDRLGRGAAQGRGMPTSTCATSASSRLRQPPAVPTASRSAPRRRPQEPSAATGAGRAMVQCYIQRRKSGLARLYPTYEVYLKDGEQFLLAARRAQEAQASNYLVSSTRTTCRGRAATTSASCAPTSSAPSSRCTTRASTRRS